MRDAHRRGAAPPEYCLRRNRRGIDEERRPVAQYPIPTQSGHDRSDVDDQGPSVTGQIHNPAVQLYRRLPLERGEPGSCGPTASRSRVI